MEREAHWNAIYTTKGERDVSWFEPLPEVSIEMLEAAGLHQDTCVLDVGGGDSHLVNALTARGLACLAVLDVSGAALERAKTRLGAAAQRVTWIQADVTREWSLGPMDIWHDRAAFHFLTTADDRMRYKQHMLETLKPGGSAIIATFALDGPETCSGLPVRRYSPDTLAEEFGLAFELRDARAHVHTTPWGRAQSFQYSRFQRVRPAR